VYFASSQFSAEHSPKRIIFRLILVLAILGFASLCLTLFRIRFALFNYFGIRFALLKFIFIQFVVSLCSMLII